MTPKYDKKIVTNAELDNTYIYIQSGAMNEDTSWYNNSNIFTQINTEDNSIFGKS